MRAGQNGGQSNSQGRDVSRCVEIRCTCAVARPQPFLTCGLEAGIVTLTLRPQGVSPLEIETAAVNGKSVIVWNGLVSRAAPVLLAVVPVFVGTRANTGFGLAEGTAVFLAGTPVVGGLASLVHSQPSLTDRITGRKWSYVQLYCQCPKGEAYRDRDWQREGERHQYRWLQRNGLRISLEKDVHDQISTCYLWAAVNPRKLIDPNSSYLGTAG